MGRSYSSDLLQLLALPGKEVQVDVKGMIKAELWVWGMIKAEPLGENGDLEGIVSDAGNYLGEPEVALYASV